MKYILGEGCETCPVKDCEAIRYRDRFCFDQRYEAGTYRDPQTMYEWIMSMNKEAFVDFLINPEWGCLVCSEYLKLRGTKDVRGGECDKQCAKHCLEWLNLPSDPGIEVSS